MALPDRPIRLLIALRRLPVTAARLPAQTEVWERSLYRDIDTLRAGLAKMRRAGDVLKQMRVGA